MIYITVLYICMVVWLTAGMVATARLRSVQSRIDSVIRSMEDLQLVKEAINVNMLMSLLMILLFLAGGLIACASAVMRVVSFHVLAKHVFIIAGIIFAGGMLFNIQEMRFKNVRVQDDNPEIESTYNKWLIQWKQMRIKLPD